MTGPAAVENRALAVAAVALINGTFEFLDVQTPPTQTGVLEAGKRRYVLYASALPVELVDQSKLDGTMLPMPDNDVVVQVTAEWLWDFAEEVHNMQFIEILQKLFDCPFGYPLYYGGLLSEPDIFRPSLPQVQALLQSQAAAAEDDFQPAGAPDPAAYKYPLRLDARTSSWFRRAGSKEAESF
jgi:hypothetical protein